MGDAGMTLRRRLLPIFSGLLLAAAGFIVACSTDVASEVEDDADPTVPSRKDGGAKADAKAPEDAGNDKGDGGGKGSTKPDAGAPKDDDAGPGPSDAGGGDSGNTGTQDAAIPPVEVDAGPTTSLFFRGDFATDNTQELGVSQIPDFSTSVSVGKKLSLGKQVMAFDVTPDHSKVVVAADLTVTGRFDLVVANRDGSSPTTLVALPADADVTEVSISPDGTKVAYVADADLDGAADAYVVSIDGGTPRKVSPERAIANDTALRVSTFSWSPDSKYIAVVADFTVDKKNEVFVTDTTVAQAPVPVLAEAAIPALGTRSSVGANTSLRPFWASGGKVCFKGDMGVTAPNFRLFCVHPDGSGFGELPNLPAAPALIGNYGISPDGATLAFSADSVAQPGAYEIFTMPSDGSLPPTLITSGTLTAATGTNRGPNFTLPLLFSPDATLIAFVGDLAVDNRNELYVVPVAGGGEMRVAVVGPDGDANRDVQAFAWSPHSTALAFIGDHAADNDFELFFVPSVTMMDQTPVLVRGVPKSGDIADLVWRP